ncbi:MAG: hypothetical protein VX223_15920, partial [Myxococcota bacterium]|nr:hypothetical protein [Myxococcota bacterium]
RLFLNTGHIDMIFMDYRLQAALYHYLRRQGYTEAQVSDWIQYPRSRRDRQGIIRHSPGHHHHLHIRFDCVKTNDPCRRPATALVPEARERVKPRIIQSTDIKATPVQAIPGPLPRQNIVTRHTTPQSNGKNPKRMSIATNAVLPAPPETPQRILAKTTEPTPTAGEQLQALFGAMTAPIKPRGKEGSLKPGSDELTRGRISTRRAIDKPERMTRLGATLL